MCIRDSGDVTWSLIVVPALLIAEVLLFKKWCHKLCPLSAFRSLIAKANKTFVPTIDDAKCLETAKGGACGACGRVCEEEMCIRDRYPTKTRISPSAPSAEKTTPTQRSSCSCRASQN